MNDMISHLSLGLAVATEPENLLYCFAGALVGTLIGVLPGLGPVATIAILLPLTFNLPATAALIMLAGIYYGAQYGGSTSAVLVRLPGESSSVVTCLDGYEMAKAGRAGSALSIAALGSFFAGTMATLLLAVFAPPLSALAIEFGPAEYCALMLLGLVAAVVFAAGSIIRAMALAALGLFLGLIGTDVTTGVPRFTFGIISLADGIDFAVLAMGVFGVSEIIMNLERSQIGSVLTEKVGSLLPSREELRASLWPILRGSVMGSILGILPGGGSVLSSFASYALERRVSKTPERFGKGAIEGVAGPESANNAGAQTSFIPLLTLGIPSNAVMALMLGAMTIQGIQPGPRVMHEQPDLFWGIVASMWIGNMMLLILNLPLVGIWVRLLSVPYRFLYPAILLFCAVGVYSISNSTANIALVALFGVFGYVLQKLGCDPTPLLLGFVLGPLFEESFVRALLISQGDLGVFVASPISLGLLIASLLLLLAAVAPSVRRKRQEAFQE